ncbi:T9SS type A sorting domain-containing protein [bacterium]|nr:T9SS type A sorting domain-containing protein [FCB group bacterium]MBL7191705.1 T9SS type A sorting domain-containing protein [bacterium]
MRFLTAVFISMLILSLAFASDNDGTIEGAVSSSNAESAQPNPNLSTDDVFVLTPFESVSISAASTWQDNRHRAYYNTSTNNINGFLLFDCSGIPDDALVLTMSLRCYLENAFGSPSSNPVVDIYWSDDDNWTRNSVAPGQLSLNDLLVDNIPFSTYVYSYDFTPNIFAHDWSIDFADNQICLGFKNDVTYYSYVYFYGAYGSPVGPAPELTIQTYDGVPSNISFLATPVNPPIIIPVGGGYFDMEVGAANNDPVAATFHVWSMVTMPDSSVRGPIIANVITIQPGATVTKTVTQYVPGSAPPGTYTYTVNIGVYPDVIWDYNSFQFVMSGIDDNVTGDFEVRPVSQWEAHGLTEQPEAISLSISASPNPFNPQAYLSYYIDTPQHVSVVIYDIQGREAAKLADGWLDSGMHEVMFDGSQLPSGIYFAKLQTANEAAVCKLILLK